MANDEMSKAYEKKLQTAAMADAVLLAMIRAEGGSTGHVGFFTQRAFAIAEEHVKYTEQYLAGTNEKDDLATVGNAPGVTR